MKTVIAIALAGVFISGCQDNKEPSAEAKSITATPAQLELRDFKVDSQEKSYGTGFTGTGTIFTRDPLLSKGAYIVVLKYKTYDGAEKEVDIRLTDGVGSVKTYSSVRKNTPIPANAGQITDWRVVGYYALKPAQLFTDESPLTGELKGDAFSLREFSTQDTSSKYSKRAESRGTLLATSENLKKGNYFVWLMANRDHMNPSAWASSFDVENGMGTVTSTEYMIDASAWVKPPKFSDWRVYGYTACLPATINVPDSNSAQASTPAGVQPSPPTTFELRDLTSRSVEESGVGVMVHTQAALIAKDPKLAKGTYLVALRATEGHDNDRKAAYRMLVRDGLGTFRTKDFIANDAAVKKVQFSNWKVACTIPLIPGVINTDSFPAATDKK